MKTTIATTLLAACIAGSALAEPLTYTLDAKHSFPTFSYNHLGLSNQTSRFSSTTGTITLDAEARTASVDISIDMTSVDTGSALFDEHIQAPDLLDTANHPTATFRSTEVRFDGDTPTSIAGELTIKGITRPVTLTVTDFATKEHPMLKKPALGANATTSIERSAFNAGKHAPAVSDEVRIDIAIEALAQ